MTSRYRVEYALKGHRRDSFVEWIKGLTAVPFVLHAGSANYFRIGDDSKSSADARRKYAEIFKDVEQLIGEHIAAHCEASRLRQMVPSVGHFFTDLPLERAFYVQDDKRAISKRRLVAPSFNDVRMILNTAQIMALADVGPSRVQLVTFDGDVTLYDDGSSLHPGNPMCANLVALVRRGVYVGIVTAAGYADPSGAMYHQRLDGLFKGVMEDPELTIEQKSHVLIMGGECNYMFQLNGETGRLQMIPRENWATPTMLGWKEEDCLEMMDRAEQLLRDLVARLELENLAQILRKDRSVGVIPRPGKTIPREDLEEIVLHADVIMQQLDVAKRVYFCAFNGGSDVWIDIGDKRYGVLSLQHFLGGIHPKQTLHIGDQFASVGANDYKARLVACTVWVANPTETLDILDEFVGYMDEHKKESLRSHRR